MSLTEILSNQGYSEIWIKRADALNTLNPEVIEGLIKCFRSVVTGQKAVFLRSEGSKSFVAGADIKAMQAMSPKELETFARNAHILMQTIAEAPFAVVACVQGFAFGGGLELALGCDLILSSNKAKFSLPELNLGLIPGFGGTQRLIQRCGVGFAKRAILTSEQISAETALSEGLIDFLVQEQDFESEIAKLAKILTSKSSTSIDAAKKSINRFYSENLKNGLELELREFSRCFSSPDGIEGLKAFIEKRSAEFK